MATITQQEWIKYRNLMSQICQQAADEFRDYAFSLHDGLASLDRQETLEFAYSLIQKYGEASGTLACNMYDLIAELQNAGVPAAEIAELTEFGDYAKAFNGAAKQSEQNTIGVIQRMVKQVAADTMLQNAKRDGAYFAWIPGGGKTCAYCYMMSAIGWQKAGKKTLKGNHAQHIHANCHCEYVVDFKGDMEIEGYNPDDMQKEIASIIDSDDVDDWSDIFTDFLNDNGRSSKEVARDGLNVLQSYLNAHKATI